MGYQTTVRITKDLSDKLEQLAIDYSVKYHRFISKSEAISILIEEKEIEEKLKEK